MKEFTSQTGGRFTYVDDFLNLQELSLAFGEIFSECDNFIVSGCEVSGNSISEGIVYLNGKFRKVEATPITSGVWPQFIYEVNEYKNVPYMSGGEKTGRAVWGARVGQSVPSSPTALTGALPKSIQINANGGVRMKDAWFGKYALLLDPTSGAQKVRGLVNFNAINIDNEINSNTQYTLTSKSGSLKAFYEGSNFIIESKGADKKSVKLAFNTSSAQFQVLVNSNVIATITNDNIVFNKPLLSSSIKIGNVHISSNNVYNGSTPSNTGFLNINLSCVVAGQFYYRTTNIGNGKGKAMLSVIGQDDVVQSNARFIVQTAEAVGITLKSVKSKSDLSLIHIIDWRDSDDYSLASIGFRSKANNTYHIVNEIGNISIAGTEYVDIVPLIKEGGVYLKDRYALQLNVNRALADKADKNQVYSIDNTYSKQESDTIFAKKSNGFSQFINGTHTKSQLCAEIDAVTKTDYDKCVIKDNLLADIATSEANKQAIRRNIGAASASDIPLDTGWKHISGTSVYVRQIGQIVCIQGTIETKHENDGGGIMFTLPSGISAPQHNVAYTAFTKNNKCWSCQIGANSRTCSVVHCDDHGQRVTISMTYMI